MLNIISRWSHAESALGKRSLKCRRTEWKGTTRKGRVFQRIRGGFGRKFRLRVRRRARRINEQIRVHIDEAEVEVWADTGTGARTSTRSRRLSGLYCFSVPELLISVQCFAFLQSFYCPVQKASRSGDDNKATFCAPTFLPS